RYYLKREDEKALNREKIAFEEELRKANPDREKMFAIIRKIEELEPNEATTLNRKKGLETGEGDPKDAVFMQFLFREHQRNNRPDDLLRECEKRLKFEPRDYEAHYLLAKIKLEKSDPAGAEAHLLA